jgi:hypothetical protein
MAKMERLNRVGSPIDICDGNLDPNKYNLKIFSLAKFHTKIT